MPFAFAPRSKRRAILVALLASAVAPRARAVTVYPDRPVRLVDPYAPGGSTSVVSRALAQVFVEATGQQLLVDHRPGAGSNIGGTIVAQAAPDGYTLLMGTSSLAINPRLYPRMPFDPQAELQPVCPLVRMPNVLAVQASLPVRSVADLVAWAKARPGRLAYASSGIGATNHLAMAQFCQQAGIEGVHVPFKGGAEAVSALLGGQVQAMFNPASTLVPQEAGGRLRLLAVASTGRVAGLPLPTLAEAGVPGAEASVWFGLFAPARLPSDLLARLNAIANRALTDSAMQRVLNDAGMQAQGGTPDDLRRLLLADADRWGRVIRSARIRME
jgi:tripartite-type tricarboxylate transporter receptor subunit TctC